MLRRLFRPDILFLAGALQAIVPYLVFVSAGVYSGTQFVILYGPVIIWILGYASFWVGTRLVRRRTPHPSYPQIPLSLETLKAVLVAMSLLCLIEVYGASKVYGGIPILAFLSGKMEVGDTSLLESQSGFGQMGLLVLSLTALTAVIVLSLLKARQKGTSVAAWCGSALLLDFLGTIIDGKRQGLLMTLMFIMCCSACALESPLSAFEALLPWKMTKTRRIAVGLVGCVAVSQFIGGLGSIRTLGGLNLSGTDSLLLYYGYPVMNIEAECQAANGLGPMEFRPLGVAYSLLPAKASLRNNSIFGTDPPRVEITSPSGFYERLLWDTGPAGIILFSLACGAFCQRLYYRAHRHYSSLLTYGLVAWALFSSPLYNHFFNLIFFPLPAILFWITSGTVRGLIQELRHHDTSVIP